MYGRGTKVHVRYRNRYGRERSYYTAFEGAVANLQRRHAETESERAASGSKASCARCRAPSARAPGSNRSSAPCMINNPEHGPKNIAEVSALSRSARPPNTCAIWR